MVKAIVPGILGLVLTAQAGIAQKVKSSAIPSAVKAALTQKFPAATGVAWEKEKGNYEAAWGGRSKEDNEVLFTPEGKLIETSAAIPVSSLPAAVTAYVKKNFPGAKIKEASRVTSADGKISYEAEVNKKDLVFDEAGNYLRSEED